MKIVIVPCDNSTNGKLADAELHFSDGPFEGLKLLGFSVWESRFNGGLNVTFPARQYSVNGERRSFALLRPIVDVQAQTRIKQLILEAFHAQAGAPPAPAPRAPQPQAIATSGRGWQSDGAAWRGRGNRGGR